MTPRTLLLALASLAAHGGAVALLAFAAGESLPSRLFVVLSELEAGAIASGPRQARAGTGPAVTPAPLSRPSPPSPRPSSVTPSPDAVSAPSAAPAPAPPVEREAPPAPAPLRDPERAAVSAIPEESPTGAARGAASPSAVDEGAGGGTSLRSSNLERGGAATDASVGRGAVQPSPALSDAGGAGTNVAVAPSGPRGGEAGSEYGAYLSRVRRRIQDALQYPAAARRRGLKGTVLLEILIRPDGAFSGVSVATSSSHRLLDDAALDAVRSLPPQPFPADLLPRPLTVRLPVVFDLQ